MASAMGGLVVPSRHDAGGDVIAFFNVGTDLDGDIVTDISVARAVATTTRSRGIEEMKESARYVKIVEWSDEDQCYVGSSPGLIFGGTHGDNEREVFDELCRIVEEAITLYRIDGEALPPPTSGRDFANKMRRITGATQGAPAGRAAAALPQGPRRSETAQVLERCSG